MPQPTRFPFIVQLLTLQLTLEELLQIKKMSDWYSKTRKDLRACAKLSKIAHFMSLLEVLQVQFRVPYIKLTLKLLYPEQNWEVNRFETVPRYSWRNTDVLRQFLESTKDKLHVRTQDDWYKVSRKQVGSSKIWFEPL